MDSTDALFLGWDVGAWNCDKNRKSRDALCALSMRGSALEVVGKPWRGNLREDLVSHTDLALVQALLDRVGISVSGGTSVTIAIDAPLAWPRRVLELLGAGMTSHVPKAADANPYLFREQELALFESGSRPLSTVRDMIGSQSTKAIHFLNQARLSSSRTGVWENSARSVCAVETYPTAVRIDDQLARRSDEIFGAIPENERDANGTPWAGDVRDAITCAIIAWLFKCDSSKLKAPSDDAVADEGWIWLSAAGRT